MKKFGVFALAALLVVMFTIPAGALENKFGGYWRTRFYSQQDFSGNDDESLDYTVVDTRTRLYYTGILNDDLKLVNKFEFNATWGDTDGGDIGADGNTFRVKNSYADFNLTPSLNAKVGIQGIVLGRAFLFDDDFSGAVVSMKGEGLTIPFVWIKRYEGNMKTESNPSGKGTNKRDVDYYGIAPSFQAGEAFKINPYVVYATSDNAQDTRANWDDTSIYWVGLDGDLSTETMSLSFTGIYCGGDVDLVSGGSLDFSSFLVMAGFGLNFGAVDVHGEAFYATGDDKADDSDIEYFVAPTGQAYYWSEIMGLGTFDNQVSNNSPGGDVSNVYALNGGVGFKPMDGMSLTFDVWYASLVEETSTSGGETDLGIELDAKMSYQLVEGLTLDVIGAYLLAGDATTAKASNDADPFEVGSRLSLSF